MGAVSSVSFALCLADYYKYKKKRKDDKKDHNIPQSMENSGKSRLRKKSSKKKSE